MSIINFFTVDINAPNLDDVSGTRRTVEGWEHHIGAQVRELRLRQDLSQETLADQASVSVGTIRNLEGGRGSSLATFIRVLRILGRVDLLDQIAPPAPFSPMQVLHEQEARSKARRRRASARRKP